MPFTAAPHHFSASHASTGPFTFQIPTFHDIPSIPLLWMPHPSHDHLPFPVFFHLFRQRAIFPSIQALLSVLTLFLAIYFSCRPILPCIPHVLSCYYGKWRYVHCILFHSLLSIPHLSQSHALPRYHTLRPSDCPSTQKSLRHPSILSMVAHLPPSLFTAQSCVVE